VANRHDLPPDFEQYGQMKRETFVDCSCSCRRFLLLVAMPRSQIEALLANVNEKINTLAASVDGLLARNVVCLWDDCSNFVLMLIGHILPATERQRPNPLFLLSSPRKSSPTVARRPARP
jgi:hypothetical protein